MAHYRIPHPGISGCGVDWNADLAAGGQRWTNHLPSLRGKSGLASIVGGTLGAKAFSPLLTVYSNDAIGQAMRLADGFRVSDEDLDLDAMADQGSGGSFLTSSLTLGSFREAYYGARSRPKQDLKQGRRRFGHASRICFWAKPVTFSKAIGSWMIATN